MISRVPWFVWPLVSSAFAIAMEVYYRREGEWPFVWILLPAIIVNYGIYRTVTATEMPSLLVGIAMFNLSALTMRILASQFILGEAVVKGNLAAAGLLGAAVVVGKLWR